MNEQTQETIEQLAEQLTDTGTKQFLALMKAMSLNLTYILASIEQPEKTIAFHNITKGLDESIYYDALEAFLLDCDLKNAQEIMEGAFIKVVSKVFTTRKNRWQMPALANHKEKLHV